MKRRRTEADELKRCRSLHYTLPQVNGIKTKVCKVMFLHTLGLKNDGMVTEYLRAKDRQKSNNAHLVTDDHRGKTVPTNKADVEEIRRHINSYHPQISHYNREHTPNRRFLDPSITITGLFHNIVINNYMFPDFCFLFIIQKVLGNFC